MRKGSQHGSVSVAVSFYTTCMALRSDSSGSGDGAALMASNLSPACCRMFQSETFDAVILGIRLPLGTKYSIICRASRVLAS